VESEPQRSGRYDRQLVRGARTNALGTAAKVLHPLFLIPATRLYGPTAFGLYLIVTAIVELCGSLVSGGLRDGLVVFAGRRDPQTDPDHRVFVHRLIGAAFQYGAIGCALLVAVALFVGDSGLQMIFSRDEVARESGRELAALVPIVVWALPCMVIADLAIAATKSLMIMEYDTIILGFGKPALLIITAIVGVFVSPDVVGLAWAFVVTHLLLAVAAIWALARHFDLRELGRAALRPRWERGLIGFAVPQSLNMSLTTFMTSVDQFVLGYFGVAPALIAFYGTAARILRSVRQAKLTFSGAFAPVIARLYAERKIADLEQQAGTVARWSTMIAMPALLAVVGLRRELMLIFDESYTHDTTFMLLLVVLPLLSCVFGIAGNVIVMTGHSRWNLFNSLLTAALTLALAPVLVPRWGLMGAAGATFLTAVIVTALQVVEAKRLVGVGVAFRLIYKPLVAGAVGAFVLFWLGESLGDSMYWRIAATAVALGTYLAVLVAMRIDPQDRRLFGLDRTR
jgi:O-antigen/teichoic acid export membrane protein